MGDIIAITGAKRRSGKTATAVNLAATLAEQGRSVLLVDLCSSNDAGAWYGLDRDPVGTAEVIAGRDLRSTVAETCYPGVDVLAATHAHIRVSSSTDNDLGLFHRELIAAKENWDYVVLDIPHEVELLGYAGLMAADRAIVVVRAGDSGVSGIEATTDRLWDLALTGRDPVPILGYLVTIAASHEDACRFQDMLRGQYGGSVLDSSITQHASMRFAAMWRQPVTTFSDRNPVTLAYRSLAVEVLISIEMPGLRIRLN